MAQSTLEVRGSMRTAFWCWMTKMVIQWAVVCGPFVIGFTFICRDVVHILALKLIIYSILLSTITTILMMAGRITAETEGLRYRNPLIFKNYLLAWKEINFSTSCPFSLKKPIVLADKSSKNTIKIWESMNGYQELKQQLMRHQISLDQGKVAENLDNNFRPLDDVIGEALGRR